MLLWLNFCINLRSVFELKMLCKYACCRADVLSMTTVDFMSKEDAIQYCERNGSIYALF